MAAKLKYMHQTEPNARIAKPADKRVSSSSDAGSDDKFKTAYYEAETAWNELEKDYKILAATCAKKDDKIARAERALRDEQDRHKETRLHAKDQAQEALRLKEAKNAAERVNTELSRKLEAHEKGAKMYAAAQERAGKFEAGQRRVRELESELESKARRVRELESVLESKAREVKALESSQRRVESALESSRSKSQAAQDLEAKTKMYKETLAHIQDVLKICSENCTDPAVAKGVRETQATLKDFEATL